MFTHVKTTDAPEASKAKPEMRMGIHGSAAVRATKRKNQVTWGAVLGLG